MLKISRGDSPPIARVIKVQPANVVIGDGFTLTCNGKPITYNAAASTVADVVNGLVGLLNQTTINEFKDFLASASADGTYFTLTAAAAGVDFAVTASTTTSGSVTVTESTPGKFAVNEVHQIALVGAYTGGTFTITYNVGAGNVTTAAIAWNASAATVQAALVALAGVGAGQVLVTGGPGPSNAWYVQWTGTLGGQVIAPGTINGTSLTGAGSVMTAEVQIGNGLSDDLQMLDLSVNASNANAGSYTLTLDGQTTAAIAINAGAPAVQTAIQALPNVGAGNCLVFGGPATGQTFSQLFFHFTGALAAQHVSTLTVGSYTGLGLTPLVSVLQNGGQTSSDDFQFVFLNITGVAPTFTLTYAGQTTAPINFFQPFAGDLPNAVTLALQGLSTIGSGNATVIPISGAFFNNSISSSAEYFVVHFTGAKANTRTQLLQCNSATGGPTVTRLSLGQANTNEIQSITVFGTGGTFTLTLGAQTTSAIAWNAATGTIQTRIQTDLAATVTGVTVTGSGTPAAPWQVTFTTPANTKIALMTTGSGSLTGGSGTVIEQTPGAAGVNEVQLATVIAGASGGTFTLSFGGLVTGNLAWNASAGTVQTALTGLATVNTVTVGGSAGGPYTITWSGAQGKSPQPLIVGNGSLLTGQSGNQTLTLTTLTWSSGPLHYNDPLNWSPAGVPNSGDQVAFEQGGTSCLYGLNQISTFTWATGPNLGTWAAADLIAGQSVYLTTTNALPAGLAVNTLYYLVNVNRDAGTFQLSLTLGGAAVTVTTTGTGVHTVGVRLASLEDNSRWTGALGLPQQNSGGYFEYRQQYLHIGFATVAQMGVGALQSATIGSGQGSGGGIALLDSDVDQVAVTIISSTGSGNPGVPSCLWKGQHASNTLNVLDGSVGVALYPNETAVLASFTERGGSVETGPGLTINGPVVVTGGSWFSDGSIVNGAVTRR